MISFKTPELNIKPNEVRKCKKYYLAKETGSEIQFTFSFNSPIFMPQLPPNPTLSQYQNFIKELCALKGWDKNNHLQIFLLFSEEVGELAKAIRKHDHLFDEAEKSEHQVDLEGEFADVLNYLLDLANYFQVDLESAFRKKNEQNLQRNWD